MSGFNTSPVLVVFAISTACDLEFSAQVDPKEALENKVGRNLGVLMTSLLAISKMFSI